MAVFAANLGACVRVGCCRSCLLLQTRRQLTARELADELEVSLRTIYRDVEALAAAGVPVYADQGRAGGYRLVEGYRTRLTGLTEQEAAALFLVGLPGAAAAFGLTAETSGAELKLLAALAPDQRDRAGRLKNRFHLDLPAWYQDAENSPHLAAVADAVLHDRRIKVALPPVGGAARGRARAGAVRARAQERQLVRRCRDRRRDAHVPGLQHPRADADRGRVRADRGIRSTRSTGRSTSRASTRSASLVRPSPSVRAVGGPDV